MPADKSIKTRRLHANANVTDPDMDITSEYEFADVDNEYEGLTITEPMDEVELIEFCTGYNVL